MAFWNLFLDTKLARDDLDKMLSMIPHEMNSTLLNSHLDDLHSSRLQRTRDIIEIVSISIIIVLVSSARVQKTFHFYKKRRR